MAAPIWTSLLSLLLSIRNAAATVDPLYDSEFSLARTAADHPRSRSLWDEVVEKLHNASSGCSSFVTSVNYTLCFGNSLTWSSAACTAESFHDSGTAQFQAACQGDYGNGKWRKISAGFSRKALATYYIAQPGSCRAVPDAFFAFRVQYYCAGEGESYKELSLDDVRPAQVRRGMFEASPGPLDSYSCLMEAFVHVPEICKYPDFANTDILRFEQLEEKVYKQEDLSGFADSGGARPKEDTYGEVTTHGAMQMLASLPPAHALDSNSRFFDLGSGIGKLVLLVAMTTPANATGIELSPARAAMAAAAKARSLELGHLSAEEAARATLIEGDAFGAGRAQGATHLYVANLCFPKELNERLLTLLSSIEDSLRCVMTLAYLPVGAGGVVQGTKCLRAAPEVEVAMTWNERYALKYYCCDCCDWHVS